MLHFYEFTIPFQAVFKTGAGNFSERSGILIHFQHQSVDVLAEASPLPGFSQESIADVKSALVEFNEDIESFFISDFSIIQLRSFLKTMPDIPSLQFAVSYMGLDILSTRKNIAFHKLLERPFQRKLNVNHITGGGDAKIIQAKIEDGIKSGFKTFKIKAPYPAGNLADILTALYKRYPHILFRLDANQSWPLGELEKLTAYFMQLPVDYIEEPVWFQQIDNLQDVLTKSKLPIALDESITSLEKIYFLLTHFPEVTLVIKPAFFGNLFDLVETISSFSTLLSSIIVTTSMESRVGRSMVAALASVIGHPAKAHGLDTGRLFKYDLIDDFTLSEGILEVPKSGRWKHSISNINSNLIDRFF